MTAELEVERVYEVPTHLGTSGSFGIVPTRVVFLAMAAGILGMAPALATYSMWTDGDVVRTAVVLFVPLVSLLPFMAWWQDPPPEHGFAQMVCWPFRRKRFGHQHIRSLRNVRVEGGAVFVGAGDSKECRAVLALQTINASLASPGARRRHHRQLGALLDGLSAFEVQIVIRSIVLPRVDALSRMRLHLMAIARQIADWLDSHYQTKEAIERPRFLIIPAPDPDTLDERVDSLARSLRQINMEPERLTDPDELRDIINTWWTWRPHDERLGPEHGIRHADCLEIDGEFLQLYALGKCPPRIVLDWWQRTVDGDLPVDVSMRLQQQSLWWAKMRLDMRVNDLSTSVLTPSRAIALEQAKKLRWSYERDTKPWNAEILFVVRGHTEKQMRDRARRLRQQHKDLNAHLRLMRWEQLEAMERAQPLLVGDPLPHRQMQVETGTLARTTPLSASSLQVRGGVPWGFAGTSPILLTMRQPRRVVHMGWYGAPNAGKGFGVRVLMARRFFAERLRIYAWDNDASHHEYAGRFCEFLGGVRFTPTSLDELRDFVIDPVWQMVAFDTTELRYDDLGEAFAVFKEKVESHCLAYRGPAAIIVDEATDIAEHPDQRGANAMANGVTHHRKFGIEWHVITQRASDWFGTRIGSKIQGSLGAKWYGLLESTELTVVAPRIGLSPEEFDLIESAGIGQGLLIAFGKRVWADLYDHASPDEYAMAHTDPPESADILSIRSAA